MISLLLVLACAALWVAAIHWSRNGPLPLQVAIIALPVWLPFAALVAAMVADVL